MPKHMRSWPHYRHIADEHIEKLRKFVKIALAQKPAKLGMPRVVQGNLLGIGFLVHAQGPELITPEGFVISSRPHLHKKHGAF
jgi:hypothetical protein